VGVVVRKKNLDKQREVYSGVLNLVINLRLTLLTIDFTVHGVQIGKR